MKSITTEYIRIYLESLAASDTEREMIASSAYRYAECLRYFAIDLDRAGAVSLVEIGTGRGWVSLLIRHFFPSLSVTAADVDIEVAVRERLERHGIRALTGCRFGGGGKLPIDSGSFDICVCFEVFEHIIEVPELVFAELSRITSSGGRLLFTTPNLAYLFSRVLLLFGIQPQFYLTGLRHGRRMPRNHFREWTLPELQILMSESGLLVERHGFLYGHGGEGVARRAWYLRLAVIAFRQLLRLKKSFRGVVAVVGLKRSPAEPTRVPRRT